MAPMLSPEAHELFRISWPQVVSEVIYQATDLTTILFVGSLDDAVLLGAVGLGNMAQTVFGFSLGIGLNSALCTLVSQSHGAGEHEFSGVFLRQAQMLSLSVAVPCMVGQFFVDHFFLGVGINARTASDAGDYVRGTLLSLPFYFLFEANSSFLTAMKITRPVSYVSVVVGLLHPLWCVLFLKWLGWGALGAGLTVSCSNTLCFVFLTSYIATVSPGPCRQAWRCCPWWPFTSRPSAGDRSWGILNYLEVALPSALLMWSEWWAYEIMTLLAGLCGTHGLAAHTAVCNILLIILMVPSAMRAATASMVGNAVGENNGPKARAVVSTACKYTISLSSVLAVLAFLLRQVLARLFTTDPQVVAIFGRLCWIMCPFIVLDSLQTVLEGALIGFGLQGQASKVKLGSMFGVRLLVAYFLGVRGGIGVLGIWVGSLLSMVVTLSLYGYIVWFADVDAIAAGVQERFQSPTEAISDLEGDKEK